MPTTRDSIAVLDFGGQYAHLIATKIRALGVYAEIRDPDDEVETFRHYKGIVLSGSPALSAHDEDSGWSRGILDLGLPVLGFCFGHQEIAKHAGGKVERTQREYGAARLHRIADSPLFAGLADEEVVWMSHGDTVTHLPAGFVELGYSTGGSDDTAPTHASHPLDAAHSTAPARRTAAMATHRNAAIACESRRQYGLQFHPEVDDTPCGTQILRNFAVRICGARADWAVGQQIETRIANIRAEVGERSVLLLASGGVDSTVAALLFQRALGSARLKLLHIDNGLMRKDETAGVVAKLRALGLGPSLHVVDATDEFLAALEGLVDPEAKRRAIGITFVEVFEREAAQLDLAHALLGQGTIYPDTIETGGSKRADVIKTHHNRVPLIEAMIQQGKVIEPLADLYKVEVRELGRALGLDPGSITRHPFPGPGLGIRVACATAAPGDFDAARLQDDIDRVLSDAVQRRSTATSLRALPLPVRSVGVKADLRSFEHPVLLVGDDPGFDTLTALATTLTKRVHGINRCLYEWSGRLPRRAEIVPATVTRARLGLLREIDAIVMRALELHGLMREIWQCPTVLVPLRLDGRGSELVVVRPVLSERAMTARPGWLGQACLSDLRDQILRFDAVGGLAFDVTTKPPATIEWE